jgi:hypothetical protein
MTLLRYIEIHIRKRGIAPTRFGRIVAHDPRLVHDMRRGRSLGPVLSERVKTYLEGDTL